MGSLHLPPAFRTGSDVSSGAPETNALPETPRRTGNTRNCTLTLFCHQTPVARPSRHCWQGNFLGNLSPFPVLASRLSLHLPHCLLLPHNLDDSLCASGSPPIGQKSDYTDGRPISTRRESFSCVSSGAQFGQMSPNSTHMRMAVPPCGFGDAVSADPAVQSPSYKPHRQKVERQRLCTCGPSGISFPCTQLHSLGNEMLASPQSDG